MTTERKAKKQMFKLETLINLLPELIIIGIGAVFIVLCGIVADYILPRCPKLLKIIERYAGPLDED